MTLGLLLYVIYDAGLFDKNGWLDLLETFANTNYLLLCCAILFTLAVVFVSALKWFYLSKAAGLNNSLRELFCYFIIGRYFNLILPSSIGGDLVRIHLQGQSQNNKAASAAIVFIDRLTGLMTLVLLVALVAIFYTHTLSDNWAIIALIFSLSCIAILLFVMLNQKSHTKISLAINKYPKLTPFVNKYHKFRVNVLQFKTKPHALLFAFFLSIAFYATAIINVWLCALVFDSTLSLYTFCLAVPIIMLIMNLPISIGNVGLLEFSHILILGLFGISSSVALSAVLLIRLKSLVVAVLGWLLYSIVDTPSATQLKKAS